MVATAAHHHVTAPQSHSAREEKRQNCKGGESLAVNNMCDRAYTATIDAAGFLPAHAEPERLSHHNAKTVDQVSDTDTSAPSIRTTALWSWHSGIGPCAVVSHGCDLNTHCDEQREHVMRMSWVKSGTSVG